jgi:predicted nucleotidyltransferase
MAVNTLPINLPLAASASYCRQNHIIELALFGSALRGDFGPGSDLDLLVVFAPDVRIGVITLGHMERERSSPCGRAVDLIPLRGLSPRIRNEILASSHGLYAARSEVPR